MSCLLFRKTIPVMRYLQVSLNLPSLFRTSTGFAPFVGTSPLIVMNIWTNLHFLVSSLLFPYWKIEISDHVLSVHYQPCFMCVCLDNCSFRRIWKYWRSWWILLEYHQLWRSVSRPSTLAVSYIHGRLTIPITGIKPSGWDCWPPCRWLSWFTSRPC